MFVIQDTVEQIRSLKFKKIITQILNIGLIISSALFFWHICMLAANIESPIVVVLSGNSYIQGSMEPAYYRGDILFVTNWKKRVDPGDVIVFQVESEVIPIVHRAIVAQQMQQYNKRGPDDQYVLSKGDNNYVDDVGLYSPGQQWLHKKDILGKIVGYAPFVGYFTIAMNDYPELKYVLLSIMAITVLVAKDPQS